MSAFGDHHRGGDGPPLLLIHGFTGTWRAWGPVIALLEEQFDVLAPTVAGHSGGPDFPEGGTLDDILDGLEAMMDEVGWTRAHVAGWSMGGQLALEMAARGRALTVTAISPAGAWTHDSAMDREIRRTAKLFRRTHGAASRTARVTARLMTSPRFRAVAMRDQMVNGTRITADEATAMTAAFADTPVFAPFLDAMIANERKLEGIDAIDVPVTILWGDTDRVLPKDKHEPFFRTHLPQANFVTLVKAGHTPFWDAPERVADTVAQTAFKVEDQDRMSIQTVTGPVEPDALGRTVIHEHVRFVDEAVSEQWPAWYDADQQLADAVAQVEAVQAHGVRTIVEPTAMFGGRSAPFMQQVCEQTGIQLVACTGVYTYDYLPHFYGARDADAIAEMFVHDIETGIQGTDVKAGFIKCAADEPGITENVEKLHRACARASLRTGAPIMAHSRPASGTGPKQADIFLEEGVDPAKIEIAHTGDTDDLDYIESLLEKGVWIGLDRYGLPMFLDDERRDATTIELLKRGYADRLFISSDYATSIDWFPAEVVEQLMGSGVVNPEWGMAYPFDHVLPRLREAGVWDDDVERQVYETNPRAWLTA